MSNTGSTFKMDTIREIPAASIAVGFTEIGTDVLFSAKILIIKNTTNKDIYLSLDGVNINMRVLMGTAEVLDLKTNDILTPTIVSHLKLFQKQTPVDVNVPNGGAPTSGLLIVEIVYT